MDILLISVHSFRNAGDAALTLETLSQLNRHFPDSQVTISLDDPDSYSGSLRAVPSLFTWVRSDTASGAPGWHWVRLLALLPVTLIPILTRLWLGSAFFWFTPPPLRPLVQAYLDSEVVISKPGGFLYSSGRGLTLILALYSLWLAPLAGAPLYLMPQSIGPLRRPWECRLVRWVLGRARIVMVREGVSRDQLTRCGLRHPRLEQIPDPAFAFASASQAEVGAWMAHRGLHLPPERPRAGVTVIDWGAQNRGFGRQAIYEEALAAAARTFIETYGGVVVFFTQVWGPSASQDDRGATRRVVERLEDLGGSVIFLEDTLPPDLLKGLYARMDVFLGTRMHSNIFALASGIPALAIGYQHKTRGMYAQLGLDDWTVDIQEVDRGLLEDRLAALWNHREALTRHLNARLPELQRKARLAGELVARDYSALKAGQ